MDIQDVKKPLRVLRAWAPLNMALTTVCRAGLRLSGLPAGPLSRLLPRVGLIEVPLPAGGVLRMWSLADDEITSHVYWDGWAGHEPETIKLFNERAYTARTTLDIGAHVGYFALVAAHANPKGMVYAFEPHPLVYERLTRNMALNRVENLSCEPFAVGKERGTVDFFHYKNGFTSSSSLSREFMESITPPSRLASSKVDIISIDEFVRERGVTDVDLVKVDTEATEDAVFHGMTRTLRTFRPAVFCEILQAPVARVIEGIFEGLGYSYFLLTDNGPMPREHILPEPPWRNFYLVPEA